MDDKVKLLKSLLSVGKDGALDAVGTAGGVVPWVANRQLQLRQERGATAALLRCKVPCDPATEHGILLGRFKDPLTS